jgi:hypothetical protein
MASLTYKLTSVPDYDSLVEQPFDLKSPFRSTVPHLAYWSNPDERLAELEKLLGLSLGGDPVLAFEHTVPPAKGQGNASHTDLMIVSSQTAVGMEAKYTEGEYDLVSAWLGEPPSENKRLVLEGWLDLIARATGPQLRVEQVKDCTYQFIHRTASVCSVGAERWAVVYHGFDLTEDRRRYYLAQLTRLAGLIAAPDKLRFFLLTNTMTKSPAYADLQAKWRANEGRDFAQDIRRLLGQRNVAAFHDPVVTTIP